MTPELTKKLDRIQYACHQNHLDDNEPHNVKFVETRLQSIADSFPDL